MKSRRFSSSTSTFSICILIVILVVITIVAIISSVPTSLSSCVSAAAPSTFSPSSASKQLDRSRIEAPFRCFRPFSQLRAFTAKDMNRGDNCEFAPFLRVVNASATVDCYSPHRNPDPTDANRDGCYVTLRLIGEKFHPLSTGNFHPTQFETFMRERDVKGLHLDAMRYAIELKAIGSSTVRYKGFGRTGYSVCCAMINNNKKSSQLEGYVGGGGGGSGNEEQEEICEWVSIGGENENNSSSTNGNGERRVTKELRVKSQTACPLNDPAFDPVITSSGDVGKKISVNYNNKYIYGEVTRPLHRKISGKWEARIELYKDDVDEGIGRIVIPFEVPESENENEGNTREFKNEQEKDQEGMNHNNNAAGVVAVVSVPKESKGDEQ